MTLKEQIKLINETAKTDIQKAKDMLDIFNLNHGQALLFQSVIVSYLMMNV